MTLHRREFLRWSAGTVGATIGATLLAPGALEAALRRRGPGSAAAPRVLGGGVGPVMSGASAGWASAGALTFETAEYAARRARFIEQIQDGIAVFLGSPLGRQNNEIRYFSGVEVPGTVLIIDGVRGESTLFYTTRESYLLGENLSPLLATDPLTATGVERHFPADEFSSRFGEMAGTARVLYTPFDSEVAEGEVSTRNEWDGRPTRRRRF
ncbi:MAG: hypothetical protein ABIF09_11435, partial [Gemmatimonadota bacterium]